MYFIISLTWVSDKEQAKSKVLWKTNLKIKDLIIKQLQIFFLLLHKLLSAALTMTAYEKRSLILIHCQDVTLYQRSLWFPHLLPSSTTATLQNMPSSAWAALRTRYTARCDPLAIKCIESSVLMVDEKRCWASTAERLSSQYSWYEEKPNVTWTRSLGGEGKSKKNRVTGELSRQQRDTGVLVL